MSFIYSFAVKKSYSDLKKGIFLEFLKLVSMVTHLLLGNIIQITCFPFFTKVLCTTNVGI